MNGAVIISALFVALSVGFVARLEYLRLQKPIRLMERYYQEMQLRKAEWQAKTGETVQRDDAKRRLGIRE